MADDKSLLDDCIKMMRDREQRCRSWASEASSPAGKAVLTCCAACCDAMARSCEEVRSFA